ncbi:hypothetical protein HAT91_02834 [Dickeya solani]|nr:hypothetical protein HAT91_02834 [Dickeya solani]
MLFGTPLSRVRKKLSIRWPASSAETVKNCTVGFSVFMEADSK